MKSQTLILLALGLLWIIYWTTNVFPGIHIPMAFTFSFMLMDLLGLFKSAKATSSPSELTDRQLDFKRKLEEGKLNETTDATIYVIDPDGNQSMIKILSTGEIETEGNPDPRIVKAAAQLRNSIAHFGVDAVAEELAKQIQALDD